MSIVEEAFKEAERRKLYAKVNCPNCERLEAERTAALMSLGAQDDEIVKLKDEIKRLTLELKSLSDRDQLYEDKERLERELFGAKCDIKKLRSDLAEAEAIVVKRETDLDKWKAEAEQARGEHDVTKMELAHLGLLYRDKVQELARLREALKPFAELYCDEDDMLNDSLAMDFTLRVQWIRTARTVLHSCSGSLPEKQSSESEVKRDAPLKPKAENFNSADPVKAEGQ